MTNPFEDTECSYLVLVNDEGQHSLWPAFVEVPAGWAVTYPAATRSACLEHIERSWTDLRPRSLLEPAPKAQPVAPATAGG